MRKRSSSKRRFTTKPWNKVTRAEKYWVSANAPDAGPFVNTLPAGSAVAVRLFDISGYDLATVAGGSAGQVNALSHAKIHRFQGDMWAWLAPTSQQNQIAFFEPQTGSPGGTLPPPNIQMLNVVWLKLKTDANTPTNPGVPGTAQDWSPSPQGDFRTLMQRDDILKFQCLPVFGKVPAMQTWLENKIASGTTTGLSVASAVVVGNANMYLQGHVARIGFPRLPKEGLNISRGERLICVGATFGGPGSNGSDDVEDSSPDREIVVYNAFRMLCSS